MARETVIDLIDTYGANLKRWPSSEAATYGSLIDADPELSAYAKEAKRLDKALAKWKEEEDGASVEDEDGDKSSDDSDGDGDKSDSKGGKEPDDREPGDGDGEGEGEGEGSGSPDKPGDGKGSALPAAMAEALADLADGLKDVPDMDAMMAEIIAKMAPSELKGQTFIEYTRDFDLIEKVKPSPRADVDALENKVRKVSSVVQKDLQRIITARSLSVMQPGLRRGRINPSALHRMEVGDDRVFRRKIENASKDVAVSLLVDCSGSMHGYQFELAVEAAWCFSEVLDRLNIKNEVIGFTTRRYWPQPSGYMEDVAKFARSLGRDAYRVRHEPLYMPVAKEFGERFGLEQKRRLATMVSYDWQSNNLTQNIDGACVLEAAKRLLAQPAKRKLLMVFSDGSPCAGMDDAILERHLKEAVKEVEKSGVETVGIGIDDENVTRFYPKSFVVSNLEELPSKVVGELKRFLTT